MKSKVFKGLDKTGARRWLEYCLSHLSGNREYVFEIRENRKKRSMDANAYAWKLIGQIATDQGIEPNQVYRSCIRNSGGTYKIFPMKPSAIDDFERIWNENGKKVGWFVDDMGECASIPGFHNVQCWFGSSVFNTKEMYNLIQNLRQDCEHLGLPYLTPEEEAALMQIWEGRGAPRNQGNGDIKAG